MEQRLSVAICLRLARDCADAQLWPACLIKEVCLSQARDDEKLTFAAGLAYARSAPQDAVLVAEALAVRRLDVILSEIFGTAASTYGKAKKIAEDAEILKFGGESPASALTYGEIGSAAFVKIFRMARKRVQTKGNRLIFADLGSGRGATVFLAALAACDCNVDVRGFEIVRGLYDMAEDAKAVFLEQYQRTVTFVHDDVRVSKEWHDADIVFANWICFDKDLVTDITAIAAESLNPGAVLVTFTTAAQSPSFLVTDKLLFPKMPWGGPCTVYVHRKLDDKEVTERLKPGATPSPYDDDQAFATPRKTDDDSDDDMDSLHPQCLASPPGDLDSFFLDADHLDHYDNDSFPSGDYSSNQSTTTAYEEDKSSSTT